MIYELALVASNDLGEEAITALSEVVSSVVKESEGEIVVQDDWGSREFAQVTSNGVARGRFLYFIYRTDKECNSELARRFKINEGVLKYLFVKLGKNEELQDIVKGLKTPFSKKYPGSVTDSAEDQNASEMEKDRKRFSKKRSCWFTAKKIKADWKDPATFSWLLNEFGKISPARISGISRKHQRVATSSIKRARQLGVASHLSNEIAK